MTGGDENNYYYGGHIPHFPVFSGFVISLGGSAFIWLIHSTIAFTWLGVTSPGVVTALNSSWKSVILPSR
jgi:hypothetical protein